MKIVQVLLALLDDAGFEDEMKEEIKKLSNA